MTTQTYEYHGLMVKYWDLLRGDTSDWADRFFYLDVIKKYGQPALDVGCSSGRLLLDYLAQEIDIDGVDISPEMIAMCELNAKRKNLTPNLYVQNMAELSLPRKYRTILVPSSSIQLLLKPGQALQAMRHFYDHLESGGALASPFMTLWRQGDPLDTGFEQEAVRPEDGATIRRTGWSRFDPETNMEDTRDTWEVIKDGVMIQSEVHSQSPATLSYTQAEAVALFEQAGFKDIQSFSEFTFTPVKPEDTLFTVVGIKP
ncbi:MAG: methyltransferase domain-containing protein [Anaerolineales bacterium]|nr:MAG: methyltransferase domain-containing protein [Anaerolineales bacterium]